MERSSEVKRGIAAARSALAVLLHVAEGTRVVVITDDSRSEIGRMFVAGARELGATATTYLLDERARPLADIPADLAGAFPEADVFVNAFTGRAAETPFRIKLLQRQEALGARVGHAPGITTDMMTGGPMQVDYRALADQAFFLLDLLEGAVSAHVTAPSGTDFVLDLKGRAFESDVDVPPGRMGNLPAGEIWCAPVEDGMEGVVVVDGSIGDLGNAPAPLTLFVRKGRLVSMAMEDEAFLARLRELLDLDDQARVVGELGIGLNPGARLTGNLLEDEKAGGTAHVAFGNNTDMPGGKNTSRTHRDFLFRAPTIEITYADGTKAVPVLNGRVAERA